MPQGGSITLVMLPIFLVALRRGLGAGLLAGLLTGVIQLIFGGYFLNVFQVFLDYILAYAAVGLIGLAKSNQTAQQLPRLLACGLLAGLIRLTSHVLSGIIFYGDYAPAGTPVWPYSLIYNGSFLIPALLLAILALVLLHRSRPQFFLPNSF